MNILVTGGTSFIGAYVVKYLLDKGHSVMIVARDPKKISAFRDKDNPQMIRGTMRDFAMMQELLREQDALVHIARVPADDATGTALEDVWPTVALFESAARVGIEQAIFTSSTAAIGDIQPFMPEDMALRPNMNFGAGKAAIEGFLLTIGHDHPMRCNIIRPGLTYGRPAVDGAPVEFFPRLREIARQAAAGETIVVKKGDGTQFTWAGDLAKVYLAVLESERNRQIYHGLCPTRLTFAEIAHKTVELAGSSSEVIVEDNPETAPHDADPPIYGTTKIKDHFGLELPCWPPLEAHLRYCLELAGHKA